MSAEYIPAEPTTSWMWPTDDGDVNGATIDTISQRIHWFDSGLGCACGDSTAEQTYAEFRAKGPAVGTIPDDVLAEIHASIAALETA
jgi:hypothetical protein